MSKVSTEAPALKQLLYGGIVKMESLSRLSSMLETARDLTLEAAQSTALSRRSNTPLPPSAIKKLLDSRRESDILDGLRRVASLLYSQPQSGGSGSSAITAPLFTAVVKNVASSSSAVRKLVFALLVQLAEDAPDTALLSVNTIQKRLADAQAANRAMALRTMSAIRVPVISQIVALGVKRGAGDMSPLVRRVAALAAIKCARLDPSTKPVLVEQITTLLGDKHYYVAGAGVMAFLDVCPERLDLVHPHFGGLARKLIDMDEWGQLATLQLMLDYCRKCFPRKLKRDEATQTEQVVLDPDVELLLGCAKPLLQSRNAAVIAAVSRLYLYIGTPTHIQLTAGPLVSTLRSSGDLSSQAIYTILSIATAHPNLFTKYATHFLLHSEDPAPLVSMKLVMQSLLFPHLSPPHASLILSELTHLSRSQKDPATLQGAVLAIGRCASVAPSPAVRARCLQLLLSHLSSSSPSVVSAALAQIRGLIQADPVAHVKTVVRLARHLDALSPPRARAGIIWLVGEFSPTGIAADTWRVLLRGFAQEDAEVQAQIILLACKVYLHTTKDEGHDERIEKMLSHTFLLARYASSYELRDRARFLKALVLGGPNADLAKLLLMAEKPMPDTAIVTNDEGWIVGYASQILGIAVRGAEKVPEWTTVEVGKRERAGEVQSTAQPRLWTKPADAPRIDNVPKAVTSGVDGKTKSLDQWLDEDDEAEEDEEEESSEEETEEETDEEEESEEEETDEEESENEDEEDKLIKS